MRGLIQKMEGDPQDLSIPPPTARQSVGEGIIGEAQGRPRVREGAPPPLGGRGTPEEQAQTIVAWIINFLLGVDHIVAKPRKTNNRPEISEGPGAGAAEEEG